MSGPLLIPNLGAEERPDWRALADQPAVRRASRLWRLLFGPAARRVDAPDAELADLWPPALGAAPGNAAYPWLEPGDRAVAWLSTPEAAAEAQQAGLALAGPGPEIVRRVHDKAFAHAVAQREGLLPPSLRDVIRVFEPGELSDSHAVMNAIESTLSGWPEWTQRNFTLKPRLGCSARGRVSGIGERADADAVRGALPRLASRGGALLEPWLERTVDLSAQLWLGEDGQVVLLGTTEQLVAASGVPLGHRGFVDKRGRVSSGSAHDEALREAAVAVAQAALAEGFSGPCGVDAFAFFAGDGQELRAVVEFNARFTTGTIACGLLRRALPELVRRTGLASDRPRAFRLELEAPRAAGREPADDAQGPWSLPLGAPDDPAGPVLRIALDPAQLGEPS